MKHYSLSELERYRRREIAFPARWLCRWHLARCIRCRERLARLEADERLLREIRKSVIKLDIPTDEAAYRQLCTIFRETPERHSSI